MESTRGHFGSGSCSVTWVSSWWFFLFPLLVLFSDSLWCVVCPHHFSRSNFLLNDGDRWLSDAKKMSGIRVGPGAWGGALDQSGRQWRTEGKSAVPTPACQKPRVGDAKPTSQRGCMEDICRLCPHGILAVGRLHRLRVMEKTVCWRTQLYGPEKRSCAPKSRRWSMSGTHWRFAPLLVVRHCTSLSVLCVHDFLQNLSQKITFWAVSLPFRPLFSTFFISL